MDHYNFLMGAKVGDLFHSLVAPAYMHLLHGKKSNFYITEAFDKFETSLERTIEELEPIMAYQPYINSFEKFRNGIHKVDFDLNMFRFSGVGLNHANITFLMAMQTLESVSLPLNFQYLHAPVLEEYKDYLIISRKPSRTQWNDFVEIQYKHVMSQFDKKLFDVIFLFNFSTSIPKLLFSISQKIGTAFCIKIHEAVDIQEKLVTITSSPTPTFRAFRAKCKP